MRVLIVSIALAAGIASGASAAEITISQKDKAFSEKSVEISAGDTIRFVNEDDITHNVHSGSGGNTFDLGAQSPGTESSQTFSQPGEVKVRCAIHPKMKLTVTVK